MTKIEHAAGWANGWTKTGRRKLARFERLAKKGVRMRTLKRALVPHEVCLHVMAERARIATPKKGKPLELWPPLGMQKKPRYTADARARMSLAKSYYVEDSAQQRELLKRLPDVEVSLLRFFMTMGRRIRRMVLP